MFSIVMCYQNLISVISVFSVHVFLSLPKSTNSLVLFLGFASRTGCPERQPSHSNKQSHPKPQDIAILSAADRVLISCDDHVTVEPEHGQLAAWNPMSTLSTSALPKKRAAILTQPHKKESVTQSCSLSNACSEPSIPSIQFKFWASEAAGLQAIQRVEDQLCGPQ